MTATRTTDPRVSSSKARKAAAVRDGRIEDAETADQDLREARLAKYIRELVDKAPPLTAEQRMRLTGLIVGAQ